MIKVTVSKNKITIKGHAGFAEYGHDIVCASVSSIVTTSINACLSIDNSSIQYKDSTGIVIINILKESETTIKLINNMINMLSELARQYKKNITIIKED